MPQCKKIGEAKAVLGGETKVDHSVSVREANLYQLALLPLVGLLILAYLAFWGLAEVVAVVELVIEHPAYAVPMNAAGIAVFVAGVIAHELMHGASFILIGRQPREQVTLLGIQKDTLTPYSHCGAPLEVSAYRWAVAMPGLLLGLLPSIAGIATGSIWVMLFGALFTFAASGDALILWLSRKVEKGKLVEDHPTRVGFYALDGAVDDDSPP